ncbi:hypothetical protein HDU98_002976 [Podochytrium sp. JEL0797]|nr:hypothetical protein HDU98_002976 [Podochytrium sp. JEL0797]
MFLSTKLLSILSLAAPLVLGGGGSTPAPSTAYASPELYAHFRTNTLYAFINYYSNTSSIADWSCFFCQYPAVQNTTDVFVTPPVADENQGYIAVNSVSKTIIFSIRGTDNTYNFMTDAHVTDEHLPLPNTPEGVTVEQGFWNAWMSLLPSMQPVLEDYLNRYPGYSVHFVGHSLGAAVALLAAVDLAARAVVPAELVHVINMGQPRVGNEAFGQHVKSLGMAEVSRTVHYNDIVPHLPPMSEWYRQESREYWLNKEGRLVTCNDVTNNGEDTNCMNSVPDEDLSIDAHHVYFGLTTADT